MQLKIATESWKKWTLWFRFHATLCWLDNLKSLLPVGFASNIVSTTNMEPCVDRLQLIHNKCTSAHEWMNWVWQGRHLKFAWNKLQLFSRWICAIINSINASLTWTRWNPFNSDPPECKHGWMVINMEEWELVVLLAENKKECVCELYELWEVVPPNSSNNLRINFIVISLTQLIRPDILALKPVSTMREKVSQDQPNIFGFTKKTRRRSQIDYIS